MSKNEVNSDVVYSALKTVMDPELHKDLVSLGMVSDVVVDNNDVSFKITLTTPACPLKEKIKSDAYKAVSEIPGVGNVEITMDAKVPQGKGMQENPELDIKNIVAVASGKGGVGKSTLAVNLAISLAEHGAKVGLLDADIYGPNVPTMMGIDHLPPPKDGRIPPAVMHGIKIMSIGFMLKPGQPVMWRGPMLHNAIKQFLFDVDWGELDYLVVDLPPGTGDAQISLAQTIPLSGGLIVTLPQEVSLEDAGRGLRMFQELKVPILGVVENMSYLELPDGTKVDVFGSGGGEKLAQQCQVEFLGNIPMDPEVRVGGDTGSPIVIWKPDSPTSKSIVEISEKVAAKISLESMQ